MFCFQNKDEAKAFYTSLVKGLAKFGLEIAEDKTLIIGFGRKAYFDSMRNGNNKSRTFDFLVFTHYCSQGLKGDFRVKLKRSKKKFNASLKKVKAWLRENLRTPAPEVMRKLRIKLSGYFRYYGVTDNIKSLYLFVDEVRNLLYKMFNHRSQKGSMNWEKFALFLKRYPLPKPRIYVNILEFRQVNSYLM